MAKHSFTDQFHILEEENSEDLEALMQILSKLTRLPSEQIRPGLKTLIITLLDLKAFQPVEENPEAWSQRFAAWVEGHRHLELPSLSDEAISRESIYGDDR